MFYCHCAETDGQHPLDIGILAKKRDKTRARTQLGRVAHLVRFAILCFCEMNASAALWTEDGATLERIDQWRFDTWVEFEKEELWAIQCPRNFEVNDLSPEGICSGERRNGRIGNGHCREHGVS